MIVNVGFISTAAVMIIRSVWLNNAASLFFILTSSRNAIQAEGEIFSSFGAPVNSTGRFFFFLSSFYLSSHTKHRNQFLSLLTCLSLSLSPSLRLMYTHSLFSSFFLTHSHTHSLLPLYLWLWALHCTEPGCDDSWRGRCLGLTCQLIHNSITMPPPPLLLSSSPPTHTHTLVPPPPGVCENLLVPRPLHVIRRS